MNPYCIFRAVGSTVHMMDSSQESALDLMKKYLPEYLQNILIASGYEKLEIIAKINLPSDIDKMLKYIKDTFSDHSKYVLLLLVNNGSSFLP